MTPRSLVGATMGARKRAARLSMMADYFAGRPELRRAGLAAWAAGHGRGPKYTEARALYRIGERLRLCPWRHDERGCMGEGESDCCHGSGVLPARKAVRR